MNETVAELGELIAEGTHAPALSPVDLGSVCRYAAHVVANDMAIRRFGADEGPAVRHLADVAKLAGYIDRLGIVPGRGFDFCFDRVAETCSKIMLQLPAARA